MLSRKSLSSVEDRRISYQLLVRCLPTYPPLILWTSAWLCTMMLCWGGIALLLHPNVVALSSHQDNPFSVIEPKQIYVSTAPLYPTQPQPQPSSQDISIIPILGLAMVCIVGSRLMMGRMRSYY